MTEKYRIGKTILYNKVTTKDIIIHDFKLYYRAIIIKPVHTKYGTDIKADTISPGIELKTHI